MVLPATLACGSRRLLLRHHSLYYVLADTLRDGLALQRALGVISVKNCSHPL